MHDYYYRGPEEDEVIIQAASGRLSIRTSEENDGATVLVLLPPEEIDRIIAGLQAVKRKLMSSSSEPGLHQSLDYFLADQQSRNAWVEEIGFDSLYVRKTKRYLNGTTYDRVVDIANATAKHPGKGALTALITRLHARGEHVYVENILVPRLVDRLRRMGFRLKDKDGFGPPSLYLLATDILQAG